MSTDVDSSTSNGLPVNCTSVYIITGALLAGIIILHDLILNV